MNSNVNSWLNSLIWNQFLFSYVISLLYKEVKVLVSNSEQAILYSSQKRKHDYFFADCSVLTASQQLLCCSSSVATSCLHPAVVHLLQRQNLYLHTAVLTGHMGPCNHIIIVIHQHICVKIFLACLSAMKDSIKRSWDYHMDKPWWCCSEGERNLEKNLEQEKAESCNVLYNSRGSSK